MQHETKVPQVQESPIGCTNSVQKADPAEIRANLFRASSRYTSLRSYVSGMTAQQYPSILPEVCAAADLIADQAREIARLRSEMRRYLIVLRRAEDNPAIWDDLTRGTGIATLNGYRDAIATSQRNQPFENIEELRLKAELLDRIHEDCRICTGHDEKGYWVSYQDEDGFDNLFIATGPTLLDAYRNFLACEGQWKKKKAPDESGA